MSSITGLSVKVSATTAAFNAGMNRVQDTAVDAALSLRRLGMASESAERDLDSAGRSATTTAAQFSGLSVAAEGAGFSIHGLSGSIILSLVPALGTLLAALTPVVAGLVGLATIAGAIGGIGLLSVIGGIATNTDELKVVFSEVVDTIEREFGPAFDLAADVLMTLMGEFMDIVPALVPANDALEHLAGNFAHLGGILIDALPAFMELAVTLAREFLPPFVTWAEDVLPTIPGMLMSLVDTTREVLPLFMAFGRELVRLLGPLNEFGLTALDVIAPALGAINDAIIFTLDFLNQLSTGFGELVAAGSLAAPVVAGLASVLGGPATLAIAAVAAQVGALALAFETNFANIRTFLTGLWSEFQSVLPALEQALQAFITGLDIGDVSAAWSDFESVLGEQLLVTLENLKPVFGDIQTLLAENKEEFRLIGGVVGDVLSASIKLAAFFAQFLGPAIQTFVISPFRALIDILDFALTQIGNLIESFRALQEGEIQSAANILAQRPEDAPVVSQLPSLQEAFTQGGQGSQQEVRLTGELQFNDSGELVALIDNRTEQNERNAARENRRRSGRATR